MNYGTKILATLLAAEAMRPSDSEAMPKAYDAALFAHKYVGPRARRPMADLEKEVRRLSYGVKGGDPEDIRRVAEDLAGIIPGDRSRATLIPIPGHTGETASNLAIAQEIARNTGASIKDVLKRQVGLSQRDARVAGGKTMSPEQFGMVSTERIDPETAYFVDNVLSSGATIRAARDAVGGGRGLVFSKANPAGMKYGLGALGLMGAAYPSDSEAMPRVYHGTGGKAFEKLDPTRAARHYMGKGTHVAESPELASFYAMQHSTGERVMPLDLPENVKFATEDIYRKIAREVSDDTPALDKTYMRGSWDDQIAKRLQDMGYAGVKYEHDPIRVFDPITGKSSPAKHPMTSYSVFNPDIMSSPFSKGFQPNGQKLAYGVGGMGLMGMGEAQAGPTIDNQRKLYGIPTAEQQALRSSQFDPIEMGTAFLTGGTTYIQKILSVLADLGINSALATE